MREVALHGLRAARHLVGDIYEVRADGEDEAFRILFAPEGRRSQVFLALEGFSKKAQKTPPARDPLGPAPAGRLAPSPGLVKASPYRMCDTTYEMGS